MGKKKFGYFIKSSNSMIIVIEIKDLKKILEVNASFFS